MVLDHVNQECQWQKNVKEHFLLMNFKMCKGPEYLPKEDTQSHSWAYIWTKHTYLHVLEKIHASQCSLQY